MRCNHHLNGVWKMPVSRQLSQLWLDPENICGNESTRDERKFTLKQTHADLLTNASNLREWINAFREGNGLQTGLFAGWSWVHKYAGSKRWLGTSRKRRSVKEKFWQRPNQGEMLIQEALTFLPEFQSTQFLKSHLTQNGTKQDKNAKGKLCFRSV